MDQNLPGPGPQSGEPDGVVKQGRSAAVCRVRPVSNVLLYRLNVGNPSQRHIPVRAEEEVCEVTDAVEVDEDSL